MLLSELMEIVRATLGGQPGLRGRWVPSRLRADEFKGAALQ
jgi:hypothetical protein